MAESMKNFEARVLDRTGMCLSDIPAGGVEVCSNGALVFDGPILLKRGGRSGWGSSPSLWVIGSDEGSMKERSATPITVADLSWGPTQVVEYVEGSPATRIYSVREISGWSGIPATVIAGWVPDMTEEEMGLAGLTDWLNSPHQAFNRQPGDVVTSCRRGTPHTRSQWRWIMND